MHLNLNHATATKIPQTGYSTKKSSNRSIIIFFFASYGMQAMNYFVSLRIFMLQGRRTQREQNHWISTCTLYVPLNGICFSRGKIIVYFVAGYRPHHSPFWANVIFGNPNFSHLLFMYLPYKSKNELSIDTFFECKTLYFFTYSTKILVRLLTVNMKNCLTPKIWKCAPHSTGLLIFRGKKAKFPGIFRGKFAEKSANFTGF